MKFIKYILFLLMIISAVYATDTPYCLEFHDNDHVYINDEPLRFTTRFTIECWFNVHEFTDSSALIDFGSNEIESNSFFGYGIYTLDSNRISIRLSNSLRSFELVLDSISANIWQHLAVTYDKFKNDENIVVFLNGQVHKKADCNVYLEYPETVRPYGMHIGAFYDHPHLKAFNGELDDVRFWSVLRTNEEIRTNMDCVLSSETQGLVGYYTFDQEADSLLYDLSENENHGILENMSDTSWHFSYAHIAVEQPADVSFDRLVLPWTSSHTFTSYCVDMSYDEDFSSSISGFPVYDVSTNYFIVEDVEPGTYYFRVKGHYDGEDLEQEPWSDIQSVSTVTDAATPIELLDFSLFLERSNVHISWQTGSQTENAFFLLERKTENLDWEVIQRITGAGTSSEKLEYSYIDRDVEMGKTYSYRLLDVSYSGETGISQTLNIIILEENHDIINDLEFFSIYPNPFNPETRISFNLKEPSSVIIDIYTLTGKRIDRICNENFESGYHEMSWRPKDLTSGIYLLAVNSQNLYKTHKILYIK